MARVLFRLGPITVAVKNLTRQPSGLYLYQRHIPEDLRQHYGGRKRRKLSLGTYGEAEATKRCLEQTMSDDALWASLRSPDAKVDGRSTPENAKAAHALLKVLGLTPGEAFTPTSRMTKEGSLAVDVFLDHVDKRTEGAYGEARHAEYLGMVGGGPNDLMSPVERLASDLLMGDPTKKRVLLSEALVSYLKHKGGTKKFDQGSTRPVRMLINEFGDLPLHDYNRKAANDIRDKLLVGGLKTATVKRYFKYLSAIFNHSIDEQDLKDAQNPFVRLKIPKDGQDAKEVMGFTVEELMVIHQACRESDDTPRHIVAVQSDTGARISEVVGLRIEDIILDHKTPHMILRERRDLGRTLKTSNSARTVPLVGMALWGAEKAIGLRQGLVSGWLFPQYASGNMVNTNSATNTINKWLKDTISLSKTSHSFRHAIADRLRHVDTRVDFIKAIGGWKEYGSMLDVYGQGYLMEQLHREMTKIVL